jgi:hypothetical protein
MERKTLCWRAALVAWLLYTVVLGALYLRLPPSADDFVFDYAGWVLCHGGTIYVDVADTNWPAMFWVHTLSTGVFGNTLWSFRALDYLFLLATCLLLGDFVRRYFGSLAGAIAIPLYQTMYVTQSIFFVGERDTWAAAFLILSAYALLRRVEGGALGWSVCQGISLAIAVLFRPTFLSYMVFLAIADFLYRQRTGRATGRILRDQGVAAASLGGLFLLCILWGWPTGALREFYHCTVRFNLEVYSADRSEYWPMTRWSLGIFLASWHWIFVLAILGFVARWRAQPLPAALLILIVVCTLLSHYVQGKGFGYHLAPIYPVLALFMAPLLGASLGTLVGPLTPSRYPKVVRLALAAGICCLAGLGLLKKVHGSLRLEAGWYLGKVTTQELYESYSAGDTFSLAWAPEIVEYVRRRVPEDGHMLFWGRSMLFNYLAARRSPTRFAAVMFLVQPTPSFSLFAEWRKEVRSNLDLKAPELILLIHDPTKKGYGGLPEEAREDRLGGLVVEALSKKYVLEKSIGPVDCYGLQSR